MIPVSTVTHGSPTAPLLREHSPQSVAPFITVRVSNQSGLDDGLPAAPAERSAWTTRGRLKMVISLTALVLLAAACYWTIGGRLMGGAVDLGAGQHIRIVAGDGSAEDASADTSAAWIKTDKVLRQSYG